MEIRLKSTEDIKRLEYSGKILSSLLKHLKDKAKEGVRLSELDSYAEEFLKIVGAKAAFLGYVPEGAEKGFPAHICTSVNEEVVHGAPNNYKLKKGDILTIDVGVDYKGYITDAALTVAIGKVKPEVEELIKTTYRALAEAIDLCKPGNHLGDIGWIVERIASERNFSVVKSLGGHGVGFEVHEEPTIYNFGEKGTGLELKEGMVLALEPILSLGSGDIKRGKEGSYITADGSLSAHFEKTIAVTKNDPKILTPWDE